MNLARPGKIGGKVVVGNKTPLQVLLFLRDSAKERGKVKRGKQQQLKTNLLQNILKQGNKADTPQRSLDTTWSKSHNIL